MGKITTTVLALAMLYTGARACGNELSKNVRPVAQYYVKSVDKIVKAGYEKADSYMRRE